MIPREIIDRVRESVDIVELITSYLPLKKSGSNYMGLCPFHGEKSPSFSVSPAKQLFHCFGCGEGGNAISFVMKRESLGFAEAVEMLAARAGIEIPKSSGPAEDHSQIYEINRRAADFFRSQLKPGSSAMAYAKERGLSPGSLEKFRIGYAPDTWDSCLNALNKYPAKEIERAGLAKKASSGNLIDRFRNRLIFPILDEKDRVVAFGGRAFGKDEPKYLNSPETPVYVKGRVLYGLNHAGEHIRKADQVFIVEGYMDCIALHQSGIENAVASSGTAFTEAQCRLLKRYSQNFVMVFDGDDAGKKAAARATEAAAAQQLRPSVVLLSTGKDPDEIIKKGGAKAFLEEVKGAKPYMTYLIEQACLKHDMSTGEGKADAARSLLPDLAKIKDPLERASCIGILSAKTGIPADKIEARLNGTTIGAGKPSASGKGVSQNQPMEKVKPLVPASNLEKLIIHGVLEDPLEAGNADPEEFETPGFGDAVLRIRECVAEGLTTREEIMDRITDGRVREYLWSLTMKRPLKSEPVAKLAEALKGAHGKKREKAQIIAAQRARAEDLKKTD